MLGVKNLYTHFKQNGLLQRGIVAGSHSGTEYSRDAVIRNRNELQAGGTGIVSCIDPNEKVNGTNLLYSQFQKMAIKKMRSEEQLVDDLLDAKANSLNEKSYPPERFMKAINMIAANIMLIHFAFKNQQEPNKLLSIGKEFFNRPKIQEIITAIASKLKKTKSEILTELESGVHKDMKHFLTVFNTQEDAQHAIVLSTSYQLETEKGETKIEFNSFEDLCKDVFIPFLPYMSTNNCHGAALGIDLSPYNDKADKGKEADLHNQQLVSVGYKLFNFKKKEPIEPQLSPKSNYIICLEDSHGDILHSIQYFYHNDEQEFIAKSRHISECKFLSLSDAICAYQRDEISDLERRYEAHIKASQERNVTPDILAPGQLETPLFIKRIYHRPA